MSESKKKMTEVEFEKLVEGLGLKAATLAVMRKSVGLSYDNKLIPSHETLERRELMRGWALIPDRAPK